MKRIIGRRSSRCLSAPRPTAHSVAAPPFPPRTAAIFGGGAGATFGHCSSFSYHQRRQHRPEQMRHRCRGISSSGRRSDDDGIGRRYDHCGVAEMLSSLTIAQPYCRRPPTIASQQSAGQRGATTPSAAATARTIASSAAMNAARSFSTASSSSSSSSTSPPASLLDGLNVHTVRASGDHHPLTVYGIDSAASSSLFQGEQQHRRRPILLLHGRTWSSVPVYHLLGGGGRTTTVPSTAPSQQHHGGSRSLMEALYNDAHLQPYALDFRGFGGTPPDASGWVEPHRCVMDAESVLKWIAASEQPQQQRGGGNDDDGDDDDKGDGDDVPALLGWSQGALVAQLVAQKSPQLISKLVLYGSIYDPHALYPRSPLYATSSSEQRGINTSPPIPNEFDAAIEDFTVEGTIPPEPAKRFAEAALLTDPIKARWRHLHQFNNCDPARVHTSTLVIAGDQDPYAPLRVQSALFGNLGRGADRQWSILADADHAVHLLDGGKERFVRIVQGFLEDI